MVFVHRKSRDRLLVWEGSEPKSRSVSRVARSQTMTTSVILAILTTALVANRVTAQCAKTHRFVGFTGAFSQLQHNWAGNLEVSHCQTVSVSKEPSVVDDEWGKCRTVSLLCRSLREVWRHTISASFSKNGISDPARRLLTTAPSA
jgi:hypothetical protein